jgi:hypothetical protein
MSGEMVTGNSRWNTDGQCPHQCDGDALGGQIAGLRLLRARGDRRRVGDLLEVS